MRDQATLGLIALGLGLAAGVVLFVPFVAHSYRRWGRFSGLRATAWGAALVYFWSIWAYTLLPLPDGPFPCAPRNTRPLAVLEEIRAVVAGASSRREILLDPAVMQAGLNVLLFVPFGFFLRVLGGRGVVLAGLGGLALSGFVELTQLTGVWGVYDCAYRVFDVDDLLLNTAGAVLGSLLAFVVPRRHRGRAHRQAVDRPVAVTRPRRLLGMVCDLLAFSLVGWGVALAARLGQLALGDREAALESQLPQQLGALVPLLLWLVVTLATGRTVGDLAVRVRYVGAPAWLGRPVRFLAGIGGYGLLELLPEAWALASGAFAVLALLATLVTERGRGLPGLLTDQDLVDAVQTARRAP